MYEEEDEMVVAKALEEMNRTKKEWVIEQCTSLIPPKGHVGVSHVIPIRLWTD